MKTPAKLYKYCSLNANTLRSILRAQVYHSPPVQFNDPLDCNPSLEIDISVAQMEALLTRMLAERAMTPAKIKSLIAGLQYQANGEDGYESQKDFEAVYGYYLGEEIRLLLRQELGLKGVLALSENWNEPLMWSHYGAQHEGICIEYDTTGFELKRLRAVDYNAPRFLRAHDLFRWKCEGESRAENRVFETYFYAKSPQWNYEHEWRDISDKAGPNVLHFDLTAIHLGMRCDLVWKWVLVKLLHLDKQISLFDVVADEKSFRLHRREIERDELEGRGVDQPPFRAFASFLGASALKLDIKDELIRTLEASGEKKASF